MRPRLLTVLMWLYALGGVVFLGYLAVGHPQNGPFAEVPLPAPVMWSAAAANLTIALGTCLQWRPTRWLATLLHLAVSVIALVFAGRHVVEGSFTVGTGVELAAKFGVHAALCGYWWRNRRVRDWFATPAGRADRAQPLP